MVNSLLDKLFGFATFKPYPEPTFTGNVRKRLARPVRTPGLPAGIPLGFSDGQRPASLALRP